MAQSAARPHAAFRRAVLLGLALCCCLFLEAPRLFLRHAPSGRSRLPLPGASPSRRSPLELAAVGEYSSAGEGIHICRVLKNDGSTQIYRMEPSKDMTNGWDLTEKALKDEEGGIEFDYYGGEFGHLPRVILGETPPDDGQWFWGLYVYGTFTDEWMRAPCSPDLADLDTYPHIAWVAVRTAATEKHLEEERLLRLLGPDPDPER
uniref:Uncharacterized protein n=1 Tax=Alexandrium andersonii TaxID=327968 RepID=A0A7S2AK36_9DINO